MFTFLCSLSFSSINLHVQVHFMRNSFDEKSTVGTGWILNRMPGVVLMKKSFKPVILLSKALALWLHAVHILHHTGEQAIYYIYVSRWKRYYIILEDQPSWLPQPPSWPFPIQLSSQLKSGSTSIEVVTGYKPRKDEIGTFFEMAWCVCFLTNITRASAVSRTSILMVMRGR